MKAGEGESQGGARGELDQAEESFEGLIEQMKREGAHQVALGQAIQTLREMRLRRLGPNPDDSARLCAVLHEMYRESAVRSLQTVEHMRQLNARMLGAIDHE